MVNEIGADVLLKTGTASHWETVNPILSLGEMGIESDTFNRKIGDGVTAWDDLGYIEDRLEVNPIHTDDFSTNFRAWESPSYATSTTNITGGTLTVTGTTTSASYATSIARNKAVRGRNILCKSSFQVANGNQFHLRELNGTNFILTWISSSKAGIITNNGGTTTTIVPSLSIPSYSASTTYTLVTKLFEDYCSVDVVDNGNVVNSVESVSLLFEHQTGYTMGLGCASNVVTATYQDFSFSNINDFINIVAIGDSLTYGSSIPNEKDKYPNLLKTNYINYPIGITNKGVGGDEISDVTARLGTDVAQFNVSAAKRNIALLMIGTNDIGHEVDTVANTFIAWETLVNNIKKFGFEVWAITNPPRDDNTTYRTNIKALNELIKASSAPNKIIDFYASCVDESDVTKTGYLYTDNLHLTALSNGVLANLIISALDKKFTIS